MVADTSTGGRGEGELAARAPNLAPPPGNPRFERFDGLRATAALLVFAGHTVTYLYGFTQGRARFLAAVQVADQGVAIFFLISGFLLYRPFLVARRRGRGLSLRDYARRRVLRIVPAYWVALSLFLALGYVSGINGRNWPLFYGFGQIYDAADIGRGLGVAWTLCIEVTFYVALVVFALAAARADRARALRVDLVALVALSVASLAWRAHFNGLFDAAKVDTLAGTLTWFALGMALAVLSVAAGLAGDPEGDRPAIARAAASAQRAAARPGLLWTAALGLAVVRFLVLRDSSAVAAQLLTHVCYGLVAGCVLLPGVFAPPGRARSRLGSRGLRWLGLISYGVYLYHTVVIAQLNHLLVRHRVAARYPLVAIGSFAITCACAAASYYLLERPVMRLGRRRRARAPAADPVGSAGP